MLVYLRTSLFRSPAQTLVNTVNTVGVMGKGIAKEFKGRYPQMFSEYRKLCDQKALKVGTLHLWRGESRWVLNFPTKTTWRQPSKISYVEEGLDKFVRSYRELGIRSASFPPLGCGNGNLEWENVRPLMHSYLSRCDIPIYVHNVQVSRDHVPEHREPITSVGFEKFLDDLAGVVGAGPVSFSTKSGTPYTVELVDAGRFRVRKKGGKTELLDRELLSRCYERLQDAILLPSSLSGGAEKRLRSYLFPFIASLPYVSSVLFSSDDSADSEATALVIDRVEEEKASIAGEGEQGCLSL